ncbi:MAG: hypothetical protein DRZ90_10385 [Spirochaetes bacterium]|nr:MAG: hypothetical protein DRP60_02715 [Spirochaetota bacterium]RKX95369.1 MAG: hypothetical protein DRZ90_10385 [Spirochaetota bacterium]
MDLFFFADILVKLIILELNVKKVVLIVLLAAALTGFASAGGLDMHFGLGYQAQYFGDYSDMNTDFTGDTAWMPYGIGAYAGVGYGFGDRKVISVGIEPAIAMGINFTNNIALANMVIQGRGYLKFKPAKAFTVAGFGGVSYDMYGALSGDQTFSKNLLAPMAGARITLLFLYAQYDVTFYEAPYPMRHGFGVGFAFKK